LIKNITLQISLLALLSGIYDTGRLLGFGLGDGDPVQNFGVSGFVVLGVFAVARIFAGVGMWIKSHWGTPLLFGTTLVELSIYLLGLVSLDIGLVGFGIRTILLAGSLFILVLIYRTWLSRAHD